MVCGDGAHDARRWLTEVDGVEGTAPFPVADPESRVLPGVVGAPGRAFGFEEMGTELGTHGGPRTRSQVAVVTGGHPAVRPLAGALADRPVTAADWAPTVAALLDLDLPTATGRSLL